MKTSASLAIVLGCLAVAGCGSPPPPTQGPVRVAQHTEVGPPPAISTPVPIVVSKPNPNAGRADPFVPLAGAGRRDDADARGEQPLSAHSDASGL